MRFFSDNTAPACPEVLAALAAANVQDIAYDGDALSQALDARFSELFETDAAVLWLPTGTAARNTSSRSNMKVKVDMAGCAKRPA